LLHGIDTLKEIETALGENGAINAIPEAKEKDMVKYIGNSWGLGELRI
jgi:hypothetical protein